MNIRNFHGKNLYTCEASSLRGADLRWTYLRGAALACADLQGTDLREADLQGAALQGAALQYANLVGAKHLSPLTAAQLFVPPQAGSFVGFKQCRDGVIVTLLIPEDARRSSATTRQCRAERVVVLDVYGAAEGVSLHDARTIYRPGETVACDVWTADRWVECGGGIHFYLTREEAEAHR